MSSVRTRMVACAILSGPLLTGCSESHDDARAQRRIAAQESYNSAVAAFARNDFQQAEAALADAIDAGGLQPDAYSDALLKRAISLAHLGRDDEAHAMLDRAEAGAPDPTAVHAARSLVLNRQGQPRSPGTNGNKTR